MDECMLAVSLWKHQIGSLSLLRLLLKWNNNLKDHCVIERAPAL